jgi:hypothetical protein
MRFSIETESVPAILILAGVLVAVLSQTPTLPGILFWFGLFLVLLGILVYVFERRGRR